MGWDVPYTINGAKHSAAVFRKQAQRPATDQTGVARPGDLKVVPLPSAADGFRILEGGLSLRSRFPGRGRESYGVENSDGAIDITGVEGTGSSPRRDAIVVEVLDPNYLPIEHADVSPQNYMAVEVVQNVPTAKDITGVPGFENRTAYVLAFIEWPAGQTSIQESYLKDARRVALPRTERVWRPVNLSALQRLSSTTAYPAGGQTWPSEFTGEVGKIHCPDWATHARIRMDWGSVRFVLACMGSLWVQLGQNVHPDVKRTQSMSFDGATESREGLFVVDTLAIPESMRGSDQWFFPRANLAAAISNSAQQPYVNTSSGIVLDVEFFQEAV